MRMCAVQVIQALEQLERLSLQREQESASIHELRKTVERLETEKAERAAERARFEKVGHRRAVNRRKCQRRPHLHLFVLKLYFV